MSSSQKDNLTRKYHRDEKKFDNSNFTKLLEGFQDSDPRNLPEGKQPIPWCCYLLEYGKSLYEYNIVTNTHPNNIFYNRYTREESFVPDIHIYIVAQNKELLTDRELFNCLIDISKNFYIRECLGQFILQHDDKYGFDCQTGKAMSALLLSTEGINKHNSLGKEYLMSSGKINYTRLFLKAKNIIETSCEYLEQRLPPEKSVMLDLNKKKKTTQKELKSKTNNKTIKKETEVSID